ncbi:transposase [Leisingera methylohalidivorans DSM 14336]|uniref:Transposase n=1 Tax=Leisingera methylohalidivorans DSM 14336 TaxID=999552 RepID=V9VXQ6_9RHOB|nr:transposase [Leisingera methylohalidivorans DSM 14336]
MFTSQLLVSAWQGVAGGPTDANAILGCIVHNTCRIKLQGQSMRKTIAEKDDETLRPRVLKLVPHGTASKVGKTPGTGRCLLPE